MRRPTFPCHEGAWCCDSSSRHLSSRWKRLTRLCDLCVGMRMPRPRTPAAIGNGISDRRHSAFTLPGPQSGGWRLLADRALTGATACRLWRNKKSSRRSASGSSLVLTLLTRHPRVAPHRKEDIFHGTYVMRGEIITVDLSSNLARLPPSRWGIPVRFRVDKGHLDTCALYLPRTRLARRTTT